MNGFSDGGPAFPKAHTVADANDPSFKLGHDGMSLRDYFAGQALTGWIASFTESSRKDEADSWVAAHVAYQFADAMLKAREEK